MEVAVMVKTGYLCFLFFLVCCLCTSGQPQQPGFREIENAVEIQERYRRQWNDFINKGEITETVHRINGREFPMFNFDGDNVQKMKVKEIFIMMQNWMRLIPEGDRSHRFTEMNLGGENYRFRLHGGSHGQILVSTENGHLTEYDEIAKVLDKDEAKVKRIAEQILASSNEPLNAQTDWGRKLDASAKEKMRALMVISQVAEAARPSDESYNAFKGIMSEVLDFEILKENEIWKRDMEKEIKSLKREYKDHDSLFTSVLNNEMLQNAARDVVNGAPENTFFELIPEHFPRPLKMKLLNRGKSIIQTVNKSARRRFNGKIRGMKPKYGRIPGADDTIRSVLGKLAESKVPTFHRAFENDFIQSKKGGTQLARRRIFHDVGITEGHYARRPNVGAIAARDGVVSTIKSKILGIQKPACKLGSRRFGRSPCRLRRPTLDEESFSWTGDMLRFETVDEEGKRQSHEVTIDLNELPLTEYTKEMLENAEKGRVHEETEVAGASRLQGAAESALGVHGAIVNTFASIHYFSQGDFGKGAFSAAQAAHGIGGLTGVNDVVSKVTKMALEKAVVTTAEKTGLKNSLERVSEIGAKAVGETAGRTISRFASSAPYVGLAFDAYFIAEDIKDLENEKSPLPESLKITHLILDVDITVLTLVESVVPVAAPIVGPLILASTIVRLGIDDFYLDISEELSKVKGKGFGSKVSAVIKGAGEGAFDALTLGLGRQQRDLQEKLNHDRQLLHNLSNPESYFEVTFQGRNATGELVGTVDFTAGILSQHGGFLTLMLNEDGSFTVEFPEVPTEGGDTVPIKKTISFDHPVNDVVLGIGQVQHPRYIRQETKLWFLITVDASDTIDGFESDQSSQYGTYIGNSQDNNFYALQGSNQRKKRSLNTQVVAQAQKQFKRQSESSCHRLDSLSIELQSYHYNLYGRGGNDNFFLGPQTSFVAGGDDNDFYHIPSTGGKTIIDNFASDEEMDTLFLDVSFSDVYCARSKWDLIIGYCQSHVVKIENWFSHGAEEYHRHLHISTADGVVIDVTKSELDANNHQTLCAAVSVDKSKSSSGVTLTLTGSFAEVEFVLGSNYSDTIKGSDGRNTLNGGLGSDYIEGGNGEDTYIVLEDSGSKTINNFAIDNEEDLLHIGIPYINIIVEKNHIDLILYSSNNNHTQVNLTSWFSGWEWQHMTFLSNDYVMFTVNEDDMGMARKHPLTINFRENMNGVILDLMHPENSENITINSEIADEVKTVLDSPYDDSIIGNVRANFLTCSGGSDFLQGNGGKDTYQIGKTCNSVTIQNFDQTADDYDLMLLECSSSNINLLQSFEDLVIACSHRQSSTIRIHLKQWFVSAQYQHIMVKTSDKITSFLPENTTELQENLGHLFPFQIEKDEDCQGEQHEIDLSQKQFSKCERVTAKTDACSYSISGNSLNNYIDPGPGGYQKLKGVNGTDTYVIGHSYGLFNIIDNYAEDGQIDHLQFEVLFHDIEVSKNGMDVSLTSLSTNDSVRVTISNYFIGELYQHLLVDTADDVLFQFAEEFPYIEVIVVDFSKSSFSQVISAGDNSTFVGARVIMGSKTAENHIRGGRNTTRIIGGGMNDTIIGGPNEEDLFGGDGDDVIDGGFGNDVLYGGDGNDVLCGGEGDDIFYAGMGADTINGSSGTNTVVFSGYNLTGVTVNLQVGLGWDADAEGDSYTFINNIAGTEYNDTLIGNDNDNIIRGHGGDDFIYPAGGDDILQGGTGADVYYLNDAFGHKVINNFASDSTTDFIVVNNSLWDNVCYHFLGDDLQLNFNFSITNSTEAFPRLTLNEVFLMVTLPFWLENSTYQHIIFSFLNGFNSSEHYQDTTRQLQPAIDIINNETLIHITGLHQTEIDLTLDYGDLLNTTLILTHHDHISLHLAHFQFNSAVYYSLSLSASTTTREIRLDNVTAGMQHSFSLVLSSCGLTVAMSPLLLTTTFPSPPTDVRVTETISDAIFLEWTAPDNDTNPFVDEYQYIIAISNDAKGESFEFITEDTGFLASNLIPETEYNVTVCSKINNITTCSFPMITSTAENNCSNLQSLPPHYLVGEFQRNLQGQITTFVSCGNGYQLVGDHRVLCNDTASMLPQCNIIVCQVPSILHAEKIMGPNYPGHTDSVRWRCHNDYWVSDSITEFSSVCIEGEWLPPIQNCVEKPSCLPLSPPQNGRINSTAHHIHDVISYNCDIGFTLHGSDVKACMLNGSNMTIWSPTDEVNCHALECSLPSIPHARVLTGMRNPSQGDSVQWSCESRYWVSPGREKFNSTCHAGSWSPPLSSCSEKPTCVALISPQHGSMNSTSFYVYDVISYTCDLGYVLNGTGVKTCRLSENSNGTFWFPTDEVSCHALECLLPSIPHANILTETSDPSHGDVVEWGCDDDYWVSQGVTVFRSTCSAGSWDPRIQSCIEKPRCSAPALPLHGSINTSTSIFHVNDAVSYTCSEGYTFEGTGTEEKQCTLNENTGTTFWSPAGEVNCKATECSLPVISHANILSGTGISNPIHGDTVFWGCQSSYWVNHGMTEFNSTCFAGSWIPPIQSCTRKPRCPTPTVPQHGSINYTAPYFYVDDVIRFSCNFGYDLNLGNPIKQCLLDESSNTADWSPADEVTCNAIVCSLPSTDHADRLAGSSNPSHGDSVEWGCQNGYWVRHGVTTFTSMCSAGSWNPPVQRCIEKPTCSALEVPQHGQINSSASVFYVDDVVSYSCDSGYTMEGAEVRRCLLRNNGYTTYWSPHYVSVNCQPMRCPDLLIQHNGHYNLGSSRNLTGDTVELVCNPGYYIRNDRNHPETVQLSCQGTHWTPTPTHCQVILQVSVGTQYINKTEGTARYAISSLENTPVPSNLYGFACNQMIGDHLSYVYVGRSTHYKIAYQYYWQGWRFRSRTRLVPYSITTLRCYTRLSLSDGPNSYDGILTVHTRNGEEKVCVEHSSAATLACNSLGFQQYTATHYQGRAVETTLSVTSDVITNVNKTCSYRIKCRQSCRALPLGNGDGCLSGYEGQLCTVTCNTGYALIGSSSLTCNSNGLWNPNTGIHPSCSDNWEADVERESRSQSSRSHESLAIYLRDYLHQKYPGVYWIVIVYDNVTGYPKHTVRGSYYHLFRHYGHNIVVSRIIPGPSVHSPDNLGNVLSQSYRKREVCVTVCLQYFLVWCTNEWTSCSFNAKNTNNATWNELQRHVSPVLLHVTRSGISLHWASWFNNRHIVGQGMDGGYVVLIANQR